MKLSWAHDTRYHWWFVKIGLGNGLVPSVNISQYWPSCTSPYDITRPRRVLHTDLNMCGGEMGAINYSMWAKSENTTQINTGNTIYRDIWINNQFQYFCLQEGNLNSIKKKKFSSSTRLTSIWKNDNLKVYLEYCCQVIRITHEIQISEPRGNRY